MRDDLRLRLNPPGRGGKERQRSTAPHGALPHANFCRLSSPFHFSSSPGTASSDCENTNKDPLPTQKKRHTNEEITKHLPFLPRAHSTDHGWHCSACMYVRLSTSTVVHAPFPRRAEIFFVFPIYINLVCFWPLIDPLHLSLLLAYARCLVLLG